jgi:aldehyde:ferredoxin oxidoreductase
MEILGVPKKIDRFGVIGKADLLVRLQNGSRVTDSLVTCKFAEYSIGADHLSRFLTAVTGKTYTASDLDVIGERIWNLERLFNLREGFVRADDTLPERCLNEPFDEGPSKGVVVHIKDLLDHYYEVRGWDENGVPTDQTLERLNLRRLA